MTSSLFDPPTTRLARQHMVRAHLMARGICQPEVLAAMARMPRELFIPLEMVEEAYYDGPLPIGCGQTISQPYMVAVMAELLGLTGQENVLEVGAGSGYGAAILSQLARQVVAVERIADLLATAQQRWQQLHLDNIVGVVGDGGLGWPDHAPYDAIAVTAAAPKIPPQLIAQLKPATGRLVIPVGPRHSQNLLLVKREATGHGYAIEYQFPCVFVPLVSPEAWPPSH